MIGDFSFGFGCRLITVINLGPTKSHKRNKSNLYSNFWKIGLNFRNFKKLDLKSLILHGAGMQIKQCRVT